MRGRTRTALTEKRASLGESLPGSVIKSSPLAPSKMIHRRTMVRQDCPESKTYAHAREHTRPGVPWSPRERDKKRRKRKREGKKKRLRRSFSMVWVRWEFQILKQIRVTTRPLKYHEGHTEKEEISRSVFVRSSFLLYLSHFSFPPISPDFSLIFCLSSLFFVRYCLCFCLLAAFGSFREISLRVNLAFLNELIFRFFIRVITLVVIRKHHVDTCIVL